MVILCHNKKKLHDQFQTLFDFTRLTLRDRVNNSDLRQSRIIRDM